MAIFGRKKDIASDSYYQEKRGYKPMAWLLAIITFVVTLLVILSLFIAGRWVWNRAFSDDTNTTQSESSNPSIDGTVPGQSNQSSNGDSGQTSSTNTTTPSQAPTPAPSQPAPTPNDQLVRTGPEEDL